MSYRECSDKTVMMMGRPQLVGGCSTYSK